MLQAGVDAYISGLVIGLSRICQEFGNKMAVLILFFPSSYIQDGRRKARDVEFRLTCWISVRYLADFSVTLKVSLSAILDETLNIG